MDICFAKLENWLYSLRPTTQMLLNTDIFKVEKPKTKKQRFLTIMTHTYDS